MNAEVTVEVKLRVKLAADLTPGEVIELAVPTSEQTESKVGVWLVPTEGAPPPTPAPWVVLGVDEAESGFYGWLQRHDQPSAPIHVKKLPRLVKLLDLPVSDEQRENLVDE